MALNAYVPCFNFLEIFELHCYFRLGEKGPCCSTEQLIKGGQTEVHHLPDPRVQVRGLDPEADRRNPLPCRHGLSGQLQLCYLFPVSCFGKVPFQRKVYFGFGTWPLLHVSCLQFDAEKNISKNGGRQARTPNRSNTCLHSYPYTRRQLLAKAIKIQYFIWPVPCFVF